MVSIYYYLPPDPLVPLPPPNFMSPFLLLLRTPESNQCFAYVYECGGVCPLYAVETWTQGFMDVLPIEL